VRTRNINKHGTQTCTVYKCVKHPLQQVASLVRLETAGELAFSKPLATKMCDLASGIDGDDSIAMGHE
jgi:hypothetical protein